MELVVLAVALLVTWAIRSLVLFVWRTRSVAKQPPPG
jgi:hypothetical protein